MGGWVDGKLRPFLGTVAVTCSQLVRSEARGVKHIPVTQYSALNSFVALVDKTGINYKPHLKQIVKGE